ncbi:28S ribosomal protein S9, mitochondrial-like [Ctenocephalides felis]|uniref:28S ribosomal protein S9, mitochondrial-like n=1 Tax=Ctenocephalides felis TaxID=7515 RepID=UPI000E6E4059|nr:28S ribosomal protein S9, mitochondrial-like [Ctenocephalides felis]XP_026472422.1 28S ribosomal protein S9, mitochondrial-like [Ctenocephalides felis]
MSATRLKYLLTNNLYNFSRISTALNHVNKVAETANVRLYSSEEKQQDNVSVGVKEDISKAMKAYLQRAREHDEFMEQERHEYQIGKRHLANIMGEDPETFTQEDIDRSIQYLFPSGLFDPRARPIMRPPEEVFPQRKAAEFDETGRPFHSLFYTMRPNFYQLLYDIAEHINNLHKFQDQMIRKGQKPDPSQVIDTSGSVWLGKEALEDMVLEQLIDKEYNNFVSAMDRLVAEPYSYRIKDFIEKFRKPLMSQTKTYEVPKVKYGEDGRAYITTYECLRKRARGDVTIRSPGTGKITINGEDISYFKDTQPREQLLFPLIFTGMNGKVDIEANVEGGGPSGQAGAIRWGIAWGLRSFVDQEMIEKMRLAGLLTRDYRRKERKKPGQEGARRKFTWKKR